MWMLIWNNIARRRVQSVLTITITMLTMLVFVVVMGIFQVATQGLELSRERLGADAILVPKYTSATGGDLLFTAMPENIYMPVEVVEQAKQLEGVAAVTPQFYSQTLDLSCCDTGSEKRIVGYDPSSDFVLTPYFPSDEQKTVTGKELILGGNFFEEFVGQSYLLLGESFSVVNRLQPTGTGMDDIYFMHIDTARQLCLDSVNIAQEWQDRNPYEVVSVIMVKLAPNTDPNDFIKQVEASGMDARVILTSDTISSLQNQLEAMIEVMFALWLASLLIAVLALVGRFNALAKERKKEIGLLRAIGLKKGQVFGLMIGETCTMALMGGILGSGMALLCMDVAIETLREAFKLSPAVWSNVLALRCGLTGVALAGVLGFVSALVPAIKSASMEPQTAMTQGEV